MSQRRQQHSHQRPSHNEDQPILEPDSVQDVANVTEVTGTSAASLAQTQEPAHSPSPDRVATVEPKPMPESVNADGAAMVSENYAYWREHGGIWADEYAARKRRQPYFHLQEIMIADYALRTAERLGRGVDAKPNLRVLELGCGPGRHLRNLSRLPGIDVHGYDQSPTMVSGMLRWTGQGWIDEHVTLGMPTGKLPFADRAFDLVYTSEVLVHVRPEDLGGILSELVRVSRGQVLHIEPSDAAQICREAHDGCWKHDLVAAYERLGISAQLLPSGYRLQRPTRVVIDAALVPYTWPAHILDMFRSFEQDMEGTIEGTLSELASTRTQLDRAAESNREALAALARSDEALTRERAALAAASTAVAEAGARVSTLQARVHELEQGVLQREGMMSVRAAELAASVLEASALRAQLHETAAAQERRDQAAAATLSAMEQRQQELCAEIAALRAEREADQQTFRARSAELELEALRQRLAADHYKGLKERFVAAAAPMLGL